MALPSRQEPGSQELLELPELLEREPGSQELLLASEQLPRQAMRLQELSDVHWVGRAMPALPMVPWQPEESPLRQDAPPRGPMGACSQSLEPQAAVPRYSLPGAVEERSYAVQESSEVLLLPERWVPECRLRRQSPSLPEASGQQERPAQKDESRQAAQPPGELPSQPPLPVCALESPSAHRQASIPSTGQTSADRPTASTVRCSRGFHLSGTHAPCRLHRLQWSWSASSSP